MKKIDPKKIKIKEPHPDAFIPLDKEEQELMELDGEVILASPERIKEVQASYQLLLKKMRQKKDAVLSLRINKGVLEKLKGKAKRHGIKYQTYISDLLTFEAEIG